MVLAAQTAEVGLFRSASWKLLFTAVDFVQGLDNVRSAPSSSLKSKKNLGMSLKRRVPFAVPSSSWLPEKCRGPRHLHRER